MLQCWCLSILCLCCFLFFFNYYYFMFYLLLTTDHKPRVLLRHFYPLIAVLIHTHQETTPKWKGLAFSQQLDVKSLCGWTIEDISDWSTLFFHIMTRWILSVLRTTQSKSFPAFWDCCADAVLMLLIICDILLISSFVFTARSASARVRRTEREASGITSPSK